MRSGAVAQLGERLTGSQKVEGSNPSSSTIVDNRKNPCSFRGSTIWRQGQFIQDYNFISGDSYLFDETADKGFLIFCGALRECIS